jgi:aminoglycoside N3'-acetyltransferase
VIQALLAVLGPDGTLVMPGETPQMSDPGKIGSADSLLFRTRTLVDFAESYFRKALGMESAEG